MGIVISAIAAAAMAAGEPNEALAEPIDQQPPEYPMACAPPESEDASEPQRVTVAFDLTRGGLPENVRASESTDKCFEDVAVAAVRGWEYEPRRVDGRARAQTELEATFTFVFEESTDISVFDASPIERVPPMYPSRCQRKAKSSEKVILVFDVTEKGATENIVVEESSNRCFEAAAKAAVAKWRYRPKILDGKAVPRKGVMTQITFRLDDGRVPPEARIRPALARKLNRASRKADDEAKIAEALQELEDIEAKYGGSFSKAESGAFHQIRGSIRIRAGNYVGALDDYRIAQKNVFNAETQNAISKLILALEAELATGKEKTEAAN